MTTSKQDVDLTRYNGAEGERQSEYRDGSRGFNLPSDVPAYAKVFRLHKDKALSGWTVELSFFIVGVKVFLRYDRPSTLKIFVQEKDQAKPTKIYQLSKEET